MKRKTTLYWIAIVTLFAFVQSCTHDPYPPEMEEIPDDTTPVDTTDTTDTGGTDGVSYSADVQPILSSVGCVGCHSAGTPNYSDYAGTKASADNGSLLGAIKHESGWSPMPKNGNKLSDDKISTIETWISEGTKDN